MAFFPGTFIPTGAGSTAMYSHFIDDLLTPRLMSFRQIHIHDEQCELGVDLLTWRTTFGNWLGSEPSNLIRKNGQPAVPSSINYTQGSFSWGATDLGPDLISRDVIEANYTFDFFPPAVLEGFLNAAISIINMTAVGPPTYYTINDAPTPWEGVITDLAYAMCMEKLLLDYDLWRYRLIFAVGPGDVYGGGGSDIASQLTTLKQNAEERANKAMENEKFKVGNYLSVPTAAYFQSIRGFGSSTSMSGVFVGKLRGWKPNRMM